MRGFPPPANRYRAFVLDLDGVVYRGEAPVEGAAEAVEALRRGGRRVVFLTNNSSRTPEAVAEKLRGLGVPASRDDVVTSAQATAAMLDGARTAFVIGEEGVRRALAEAGIRVLEGEPREADAVVVGWDRGVDYGKLRTAAVLVGRGARLVATNTDAAYPAPGGELWPGAGALVAAVETATGVRAVSAGKPERPLFEAAVARAGTRDALVVGDRVETDIVGAVRAGLDAALVFSGAAGPAALLDHDAAAVLAVDRLARLLEPRPLARVRLASPEDTEAAAALAGEAGLEPPEGEVLLAEDGPPLASAAVAVRGEDAYLHSVVVRAGLRGNGLGTLVTAAAARRAAVLGARTAFLVTEDAAGFFARLGFEPVDRGSLPSWAAERSRGCSAAATAMRRPLPAGPGRP